MFVLASNTFERRQKRHHQSLLFVSVAGPLLVSQFRVHIVSGQPSSQSFIRLQSCVLETAYDKEGAHA